MIDRVTGLVVARAATSLVVDVNGIGYRLEVSLATSDAIAARPPGKPVTLLAYLHLVINNDPGVRLFGFATEEERILFKLLLPIKGVGPQTALRLISSGRTVDEVARAIASGDPKRIKAKGIGPKIAERVAIELKGKLGVIAAGAPSASGAAPRSLPVADRAAEDALLALKGLEFDDEPARQLVERARQVLGAAATADELVREALRSAS